MLQIGETYRLFGLLCTILMLFFGYSVSTYANQWDAYFQNQLTEPPEQFIVSGLKKVPAAHPGSIAIDLGSGVGHETKVLLDKGYKVFAVDANERALHYMQYLPGISKHKANLKTINSKFENLDFANLPRADLIISSFALPFVSKGNFQRVWGNIAKSIKPGGHVIINLFDAKYSFYNNKHNMSFHSKSEALALFKGFNIIEFRTVRSDSAKAGAKNLYYVIVAQKAK